MTWVTSINITHTFCLLVLLTSSSKLKKRRAIQWDKNRMRLFRNLPIHHLLLISISFKAHPARCNMFIHWNFTQLHPWKLLLKNVSVGIEIQVRLHDSPYLFPVRHLISPAVHYMFSELVSFNLQWWGLEKTINYQITRIFNRKWSIMRRASDYHQRTT